MTSPRFRFLTSLSVCLTIFSIVAIGCSDNAFLGIGSGGESGEGDYGSESNPAHVDMSQFDRQCATGAECTVVNPQACLKCDNTCGRGTGIRTKELPSFEEAKASIECEAESTKGCNNGCEPSYPVCLDGRCERFSTADMIPRSCTDDSECHAIATFGLDICWPSVCPDTAVNMSEWETAVGVDCDDQERREAVEPDECTTPTIPRCEQGQCVLSEQ